MLIKSWLCKGRIGEFLITFYEVTVLQTDDGTNREISTALFRAALIIPTAAKHVSPPSPEKSAHVPGRDSARPP
jgi:hypothetical protein